MVIHRGRVGETEVQKRARAAEAAVDPIDKLKALADLERVAKIEEGPLRDGIVAHATVGGSQATVRKAIDELIDAGQVNKLGPASDYTGRGRAPTQYSRT